MENRYLYRAKRVDNGEFVIGNYQRRFDLLGNEEHYIFCSKSHNAWEYAEVDPSTICQCTGLKDKNGKLIWENDICKVGWIDNEAQAEGISKVTWDKNGYYPWLDEYSCDGCDLFNKIMFIEVIGNIFDNPELLEQEG